MTTNLDGVLTVVWERIQQANSSPPNFDSEKEPIERQIKATDKKIDEFDYQVYGLTEEEIKVVEGE